MGHKKAVEDRTEWRTKAEHTQKKEGRKEPLGKVFKTHLSFRWAFPELQSTKTQCGTMISMNVSRYLIHIVSFSAWLIQDWVFNRKCGRHSECRPLLFFHDGQARPLSVDHQWSDHKTWRDKITTTTTRAIFLSQVSIKQETLSTCKNLMVNRVVIHSSTLVLDNSNNLELTRKPVHPNHRVVISISPPQQPSSSSTSSSHHGKFLNSQAQHHPAPGHHYHHRYHIQHHHLRHYCNHHHHHQELYRHSNMHRYHLRHSHHHPNLHHHHCYTVIIIIMTAVIIIILPVLLLVFLIIIVLFITASSPSS